MTRSPAGLGTLGGLPCEDAVVESDDSSSAIRLMSYLPNQHAAARDNDSAPLMRPTAAARLGTSEPPRYREPDQHFLTSRRPRRDELVLSRKRLRPQVVLA